MIKEYRKEKNIEKKKEADQWQSKTATVLEKSQ